MQGDEWVACLHLLCIPDGGRFPLPDADAGSYWACSQMSKLQIPVAQRTPLIGGGE